MSMSNQRWRTAFAVAAGVVAYLLIQAEVPLEPVAKLILGALSVALAFVKAPPDEAGGAE